MSKLSPSGSKSEGRPTDPLERLHEQLEEHFVQLRGARQQTAGGKPVFALEHGLTRAEIAQLQADVRNALKIGPPHRKWWLPFVVYAAELGYRYDADEYWQTFESETPGWTYGDRYYIRDRFQEFAKRLGGAQPTGIWANHFSIICWPITHAVLPKDLQFHLAHILFESRHLLTPELLARPDELGAKLASRAYGTSSRFENFAQNTGLLGQVAAALLLEKEGKSPLLLSSTLARITADLFAERQARRWLTDAKTNANRVNLRGVARPPSTTTVGTTHSVDGSPRLGAPALSLRREDGLPWVAFLELPDLALLVTRFPELQHALASSRSKLAGVKGALARGRVLYPGQRLRLDYWPAVDPKLLRLEDGNSQVEAILADEVRFSSGPVWVFLVIEDYAAEEVRGKTVRPGRQYVLLTEAISTALPAWIEPAVLQCNGIRAYKLTVPSVIGAHDEALLQSLGLGVVSNIEIRPVGPVPATWDGEGHVEWVAGDHPLIAISSSREATFCRVSLDDNLPLRFDWPQGPATGRIYVSLGPLDVGVHELRVALALKGTELLAEGNLTAAVREPHPRSSTGSYREALLLLSTPALPNLGELWDGKATMEIFGPRGVSVGVHVWLEGSRGSALVTKQFRPLQLPVDAKTWNEVFDKQFRQLNEVSKHYDAAAGLVVEVSNPDLGSTSLRAEREFAPLRWGVARDHDGPYVRLHANVGDQGLLVEEFDYSHPDIGTSVRAEPESKIRSDAGGLFMARLGEFSAAVVLPPNVRNFSDLSRAQIRPAIAGRSRSTETLLRWMALAAMWARASLPGDPFAQILKASVLRAFTIAISNLIGGPRWAAGERRIEDGDSSALRQLAEALGDNPYQASLAPEIMRTAAEFPELFIDERIEKFARIIRRIDPARSPIDLNWMSEYLLRLASSPNVALAWSRGNARAGIEMALKAPMMLRAARYLVLAMNLKSELTSVGSPYGGWTWL